MAVVARSDLVVTLPRSLAVNYIEAFELAALEPGRAPALYRNGPVAGGPPRAAFIPLAAFVVREQAAGLGAAGARPGRCRVAERQVAAALVGSPEGATACATGSSTLAA
jgi:hypothetical protein